MAFGDIVLLKDRTARGPYTRAQIQEGLGRGDFSARDLAHTPGLRDWLPLLEVLHHLDREPVHAPRSHEHRILPPLPIKPDGDPATPQDVYSLREEISAASSPSAAPRRDLPPLPVGEGKPSPFLSGSPSQVFEKEKSDEPAPDPARRFSPVLPASPLPSLAEPEPSRSSQPPTLPQIAPPLPGLIPAPMGKRCLAWAIDWAVLFLPVLIIFGFAYGIWWIRGPIEHRDPETARQEQALLWRNLRELLFTIALGFSWVYAALLESSRWQGTVGKQCTGLVVTDEAGHRLGFLRATGRHAAKYLSALPLFLGFMAAFFNPQRQAWHDRLAGTRVVER